MYHYQAANCCGHSRLEVGDKWKNILLLLKQFHENFIFKTPIGFDENKSFIEIQNAAFMQRGGLKG